ncbi:MAG: hypothetical protein GY737_29300 [Desulfobacteraceae bacterium]|nr:hypothetical protein [Desulfobacteraceae bacterium]
MVYREETDRVVVRATFPGMSGNSSGEVIAEIIERRNLFREPHAAPLNPFESYSPFKVATLEPRLPEPYRKFSETFSY